MFNNGSRSVPKMPQALQHSVAMMPLRSLQVSSILTESRFVTVDSRHTQAAPNPSFQANE